MSEEPVSMVYECPHCAGRIPISQAAMGGTVDCSNCGKPFKAEAPSAQPIGLAESEASKEIPDEALVPATAPEVKKKAEDEADIRKIHPTIFRRHLFGTLLCMVLFLSGISGIVLAYSSEPVLGLTGIPLLVLGILFALIPGFFLLKWFILSRASYLLLTSERVIYRRGIFKRRTTEIRHRDILNTSIEQNLKERFLNFGDIALSSAGHDGDEIVIDDIPRPAEVARLIGRQQ